MYAAIDPVTSYIVEALHLDKVVVPILGTPILMCKSGYGYFVHHQNREILRAFVLLTTPEAVSKSGDFAGIF